MTGDSAELALARIEVALARIEAATARPAAGDPGLAQRHEQLRGAVCEALGQLDDLLSGHDLAGGGG